MKTQTFCKQKTASVSLRWRSFYGRGWITRAAHLKKPRRGFFPRRTVRRVDAVRIHPPSLREGYYKTETPVPGSDTGVLGGRGWITQAAHLKKPRRGFFPRRTVRRVDAVRIHPPSLREGYYKTETPVPGSDTGVLGGAKQPKSEPLPSGASLAAISSKVMVFVPSL